MKRLPKFGIFVFQCLLVTLSADGEVFNQDDYDSLIRRLYELNQQDPELALAESGPASGFVAKRETLRNRVYLEAALTPSRIPYHDKRALRMRLQNLLRPAEDSPIHDELVPVLRLAIADLFYRKGEIRMGLFHVGEAMESTTGKTPLWIRFRILKQLFLLKRYAQLHDGALQDLRDMRNFKELGEFIHPVKYHILIANQYMLLGENKERDKALREASLLIGPQTDKFLIGMYWMQRAWANVADNRPDIASKELVQAAQSLEAAGFPELAAELSLLERIVEGTTADQNGDLRNSFEAVASSFRKAGLEERYAELLIQLQRGPFYRWMADVPDALLEQLSVFAFDESNLLAYSEALSASAELLRREGRYQAAIEKLRLSHRYLGHFHKRMDHYFTKLKVKDQGKLFALKDSKNVSILYYTLLTVFILLIVMLLLLLKIRTQRHMNRQLAESVEKARIAGQTAEAANRLKSQFLANISHELKTPMSGLVGMASLLDELLTDPVQRKYLSTIQTCSRNLLVLMNDLLDLGRMESGKLEVEKKEFSPRETIDHSLELAREPASNKGLALNSSVSPDVPGILVGDPTRIGQVLNNLLQNAIKFTSGGSVSLHARFEKAVGQSGNLIISVNDTGTGIPAESLHTLFEPFNRLKVEGGVDSDGSGLGLAICKKLVELMGGSISVKSQFGRGSSFAVMIPAAIPE